MSRDFIHLINPHTEPILIHQWAPGDKSFVVTLLWLNPYDKLVNITSINIESSAQVIFRFWSSKKCIDFNMMFDFFFFIIMKSQ